jgi:hypothetical protein
MSQLPCVKKYHGESSCFWLKKARAWDGSHGSDVIGVLVAVHVVAIGSLNLVEDDGAT